MLGGGGGGGVGGGLLHAGGKHIYMCPPDWGVHESHAVCFVRMAETTEPGKFRTYFNSGS